MKRFIVPAIGAAVAFSMAFAWRGYPWQLALLTALAIGALIYAVQRTWEQMRGIHHTYRTGGAPRDRS